jgi:threonine aldolase
VSLIDLRSDTVTRPTEAMRKAMAEAEVGDDIYGDDPTVRRLQDRAAEIMGKDAAMYAPSGTMCNQTALRTLVRHGHEVIAEATAHVITVEKISAATLSGVTYRPIPGERGLITAEQVANALRPELDRLRMRVVDLVAVENTHQVGGGSVMPIETLREIRKVAQDAGLPLYLDGARIFNASVASGVDVADFTAEADVMMFCLSKGLGAPIGSLLCGPSDFIDEARRVRIQFGGGWRQAGVVAAAGLVALEEGPKRLQQDHDNAKRLAEGIDDLFPGAVDLEAVETNIVFVNHESVGMSPPEIVARLQIEAVLAGIVSGRVRMLTHRDVSSTDIDRALGAWKTFSAS